MIEHRGCILESGVLWKRYRKKFDGVHTRLGCDFVDIIKEQRCMVLVPGGFHACCGTIIRRRLFFCICQC